MPKKHHPKQLYTKPPSSAPSSLFLSNTSSSQGSRRRENATRSESTVNDLIQRLRTSQVSNEHQQRLPQVPTITTLPPSVRSLLDLPEIPPPSPRAGIRPAGLARVRRIPGPPPPRSW